MSISFFIYFTTDLLTAYSKYIHIKKYTLIILKKVWCDTNDLMKLSQLGINNTTKLKKEIKTDLENQGYLLPKGKLPMIEVIKKLKIDIDYLERIAGKESNNENI